MESMDLLKVLAMPFQVTSLLFVAGTSLLLGIVLGSGHIITRLVGLHAVVLILAWLTRYAFQMIDDAANGVRKTAVAEVEWVNPFSDARCWVHPALAGIGFLTYALHPDWPVAPALIAAALLFPPSIAASAMSGRARDALNPAAIGRAALGLGPWLAVASLVAAGCAGLCVLLFRRVEVGWLLFACIEMLILIAYAAIGGIVYLRRLELGFDARISPERSAEKREHERMADRQRLLDATFEQVRARHADRALAGITTWMSATPPHLLQPDIQALLAAGRQWREPREFGALMRGLIPVLMARRQGALALACAEAALAQSPSFTPLTEPVAHDLVTYAVQSGRKRLGQQLLANFIQAMPGAMTPRMQALQERLAPSA